MAGNTLDSIPTVDDVFGKMRILSEAELSKIADWHFEKNVAYHFITAGDVDSLTFLRWILRQQPLKYACISTWCMSPKDAEEMLTWLDRGLVQRFDFYVGEIFKDGYRGCRDILDKICKKCGGRVARFRNHSKLMACYGRDFDFVIESSANIDTNPRTEQTCITTVRDLADFYINYFNKINDFDGGYKNWQPYKN